MESILKQKFGYSQFRPYQKEIIEKVLDGKDCLVVMSTGSGKSLCYQVPPLVTGKTAVVISPLLSLMQDQVMSLKQKGINAEYLGSSQTDQTAHSQAQGGAFDILYMTPEKASLLPKRFWSNLLNAGICLLAVDEAHCISEWGHDFRKEYKQLDVLRSILFNVPFIGLTATATQKVQNDIVQSLKMVDPYISIGSFDRKNLFYGVKPCFRSQAFLEELVKEVTKYNSGGGSIIIYCTTVKDTEQIYQLLMDAGVTTEIYHGQMGSRAREQSHRSFIRDEVQVMVATVAFGMGIDKPNIRCVIHYGCPRSLESYYQESGRCGRDGLPSVCLLYYSRSDFAKSDFYVAGVHSENQRKAITESLMAAEKYCLLASCRRRYLLKYFGEQWTADCGNCDNCTSIKVERDLSKESFLLLSCIQSCGGRWGLNMPIDVLRGSRSRKIMENNFDKLLMHGHGKEYTVVWWKALGGLLIAHGYLKEIVEDLYRKVRVSPMGLQYLCSANFEHQPPLILPLTREMIDEEDHGAQRSSVVDQSSIATDGERFSEAEKRLYSILLGLRMELAKENGTAPYAICGDQTLVRITKTRPSTRARLANIEGVNQVLSGLAFESFLLAVLSGFSTLCLLAKLANIEGVNQHLVTNYGDKFLHTIRDALEELGLSLNGDANAAPPMEKVCHSAQRNLNPAKFDAWKMWQISKTSVKEVAMMGRSGPIKEQTVISYILEAAQTGRELDWPRFCMDTGLTLQIISLIRAAISKIGSRERLKPIKEELPETVTYEHIKIMLTMEDLNISPDEVLGSTSSSLLGSSTETSTDANTVLTGEAAISRESLVRKQKFTDSSIYESSPKKLHKEEMESKEEEREANENSVMEFIKAHDGISSTEIIYYFKGSKADAVAYVLNCLETEFLVYKKNGLYSAL